MVRQAASGILVLVLGMTLGACGEERVLSLCDDPFPSLCVEAFGPDGSAVEPDRVDVFDGDRLVVSVACGFGECCTTAPQTGRYRVEVEWRGEVLTRVVEVENSNACDHEVTRVRFDFGADPQ